MTKETVILGKRSASERTLRARQKDLDRTLFTVTAPMVLGLFIGAISTVENRTLSLGFITVMVFGISVLQTMFCFRWLSWRELRSVVFYPLLLFVFWFMAFINGALWLGSFGS